MGRSESVPNEPFPAQEGLLIPAVVTRQLPQAFPGFGQEQFTFQRRAGLMCLHQLVHPEGAGITARLPLPDVLVKVVGVERAKQAATRHGRKAGVLVVVETLAPRPAHLHKRVSVREQRLLAFPGPVPLLPHNAHMINSH